LTSVGTAIFLNLPAGASLVPGIATPGAHGSSVRLVIVVGVSALAALVATFLSRPEPEAHLIAFYQRVRPPQLLWGPIAQKVKPLADAGVGWWVIPQIAVAGIFVYAGMLGIGKLVLGEPTMGAVLVGTAIVTGYVTIRSIMRQPTDDETPAEPEEAAVSTADLPSRRATG
jgi:hypothetical protein